MRAFNCLNRRISISIHVLGIKHSRSVWCFHFNQTSARLFFMHKINTFLMQQKSMVNGLQKQKSKGERKQKPLKHLSKSSYPCCTLRNDFACSSCSAPHPHGFFEFIDFNIGTAESRLHKIALLVSLLRRRCLGL